MLPIVCTAYVACLYYSLLCFTYNCIPCLLYMPIQSAMPKYSSEFTIASMPTCRLQQLQSILSLIEHTSYNLLYIKHN